MTTLLNPRVLTDTDLTDSRIGPDNFRNQSVSPEDGDDELDGQDTDEEIDEPVDEDGDPTGEHDHQQDDNYALGGHVTRSGGI